MRPFFTLFCVVLFFVVFRQNGRLFVFLRNIHFSIEILKIKILEYSYPPSQYFFVNKAFIRFFSCHRKVALCHLAEWHNEEFFFCFFIFILGHIFRNCVKIELYCVLVVGPKKQSSHFLKVFDKSPCIARDSLYNKSMSPSLHHAKRFSRFHVQFTKYTAWPRYVFCSAKYHAIRKKTYLIDILYYFHI